ncbi:MAG: Gfo/Idh/MocA family oxidoreductase [Chlorobiales bacterium]|nr:Gfo/Idh/MocA family oxidoreductase [Chlorobiales bacterium]
MPEKIKVGFIGSGFARSTQAPAFALFQNAELYAVASPTESRREKFSGEFQIPHRFSDWRKLIESDVALVCITTPPNLHAEMALAAIQNGKHVVCEKPFAMTLAEAESMVSAATAHNCLAVVDHELRLLPTVKFMRQFIQDGRLGGLYGVRAEVILSSRNSPDRRWNWWSDKTKGGGAMGAVGSHMIDLCHYLIGDIESCLGAYHTHIPNRPGKSGEPVPVTSDDAFDLIVRFAPDSKAPDKTGHISVTTVEAYTSFRFEVSGSNGTLRLDGEGNLFLAERLDNATGRSTQGSENFVQIFPELAPGEADVIERRQKSALEKQGIFAKAFTHLAANLITVLGNKQYEIPDAATFADGLRCQRVMQASVQSAINGCWCKV